MAIATPVITAAVPGDDTALIVTWGPMANGDTAVGFPQAQMSERTVQVKGTFGAGGNVNFSGSNDGGTTYSVLQDDFGTAMAITTAGIRRCNAVAQLVAPQVSAGDGTTALTIVMTCRRAQPLHYTN